MKKFKLYDISTFLIITLFLTLTYLIIEFSSFDRLIQDRLYSLETNNWLIDRNEPILKFLFYNLPKYLIAAFGIFTIVSAIKNRKNKIIFKKKLSLFLCILIIPLVCSTLKYVTNTHCPWGLECYGGTQPYVKFLESYPASYVIPKKPPQCFPGGHASGGFALISLFFYLYDHPKKNYRWLGLLGGLVSGHIMAFYQMAKGAHFYSHNFASIVLSWIISWIIFKILVARNEVINIS